jgi:uncharacterized protein (UPF0332 family)
MPAFDWIEFLKLADKMVHDATATESTWRTSVSRAYYATYHQALMTAAQLDPTVDATHTKHEQLIQWYKNAKHTSLAPTIGQALETLKRYRVRADYIASNPLGPKEANFSVSIARNIIKNTRTLPTVWSPVP